MYYGILKETDNAERTCAMLNSPYNKPDILPPNEHPRLMLRQDDLKRIRKNLKHSENQRAVELWQRLLRKSFSEVADEINLGEYNSLLYLMIEARAFDCLINKKEAESKELISFTLDIIKNVNYDDGRGKNFLKTIMSSRFAGHVLFVASEVYDWLYKYLTDEQKADFIYNMEEIAKLLETNYPPEHKWNSPMTGHSNEAEIQKNLLGFSIAVYDERPDIYEYIAGKLFDEYYPAYNIQFESGYHHQGSGYGPYRLTYMLWGQLLIHSMSDKKPLSDNIEKICDSFYYMTRSDGESFRIGDDCCEDKQGYSMRHPFVIPMFFAAALTGNSHYRKYYFENFVDEYMLPSWYKFDYYRQGGGCYGEGTYSPVVHLIWHRYTKPFEASPYEKSRYFPSPSGITFYKNEETETSLMLKIGEYWCGLHDHLDIGSFQIYHKGILASDSGTYDIWGTHQHMSYTAATCAHNCLTVTDPNMPETVEFENRPIPYSGGIFTPNDGRQPTSLKDWQDNYHMASVISHTETDDLIELEGDMTDAYRHTCENVVRKFTFLPKAGQYGILKIEDTVVAKSADFIKRFHLHIQAEPEINGNEITVVHKGGKLKCKVLEPQNAKIEAFGGEGKKYYVGGEFLLNDDGRPDAKESGWGQIIISPPEQNKSDKFVIEMEIMDR